MRMGGQQPAVSRRTLLWGLLGTGTATAATLGVVAATRNDAPAHRHPYPPVNPGPPTARTPGTLAGPTAKPAWSARIGSIAHAIAVAAGTVVVMDDVAVPRGFDPRTGTAKWTSATAFFLNDNTPLLAVRDTVYGTDEQGGFLAVDASNGSVRWQLPSPNPTTEIGPVLAAAGPLVFCTGVVGGDGQAASATKHGKLWAVDTAAHDTAWTLDTPAYCSAVAASAPESGLEPPSAGVVVAADETTYRLTAYSLKDQHVLWHKDAGAFGPYAAKSAPTDCVAISGSTVFWAANKLYALDAATGDIRWTAEGSGPDDVFQNVIVLPGQAPDGSDLVAATATGPDGGALLAFLAASGSAAWSERGSRLFGTRTALTAGVDAGAGVLYAAERDNGSVVAVDTKSGQTRWTYHDSSISSDLRWSIAADDARVYVAYGSTVLAFEH